MYLRCKRTNQTIFLYAEPTDTIVDVKRKISAIVKTPTDKLRVVHPTSRAILDDNKALADYKIENDAIVYFIQKKEGSEDWEEVNIQKIELAKQEEKEEKSS